LGFSCLLPRYPALPCLAYRSLSLSSVQIHDDVNASDEDFGGDEDDDDPFEIFTWREQQHVSDDTRYFATTTERESDDES
jgi:hypothetical protein